MDFKALRREPLLYFLIGGALLYLLFEYATPQSDAAVTLRLQSGDLAALKSRYRIQSDEADALLHDQLLFETVMQREARILELDRQDGIIQTRLLELMSALLYASDAEPSIEELRAFYAAHPQHYLVRDQMGLQLLTLSTDDQRLIDAYRVLLVHAEHNVSQARAFAGASGFGRMVALHGAAERAKHLGGFLASRLEFLSPYRWHGPIQTPSKVYFVYIDALQGSEILPFDEVIERVREDYLHVRRLERLREGYARLLSQYRVERE
ncbi:MAG: peptidyl-prolyl cis-trans isomerase [Campylobacterales bacterium]|nr:peptidyl-prolyl cis-trans isomerase [Campylobacterales bacterium]